MNVKNDYKGYSESNIKDSTMKDDPSQSYIENLEEHKYVNDIRVLNSSMIPSSASNPSINVASDRENPADNP